MLAAGDVTKAIKLITCRPKIASSPMSAGEDVQESTDRAMWKK